MLATAARAIPYYILPILACVPSVNAELHSRSSSAHLTHLATFAGAQKRQLLNELACALGVQSACDGADTTSDVNNCERRFLDFQKLGAES